ncbi:MAG: ankyrin repeat domain-containing protein, partial [Spirochaetia bacterium]|nr:ankyrin repeat domain-containing protein [Spirochaetia bacterium]
MTGWLRTGCWIGGFAFFFFGLASCRPERPGKGELSLAIKKGDTAQVQKYFSKGGSAGIRLEYERSLLHVAAEWGQLEMVRVLIQNGVDVNAVDKAGYTPLMLASQQGKTEIAETLLDAGAKLDL